MNYWDQASTITQDPCYFHGRPTNDDQFYVLYNIEFDRIFLVAREYFIVKELTLILRSKIVLFPYSVQKYDLDNSCCLNWSVEKKPTDVMHDNGCNVFLPPTNSSLVCLGSPPDVKLALETQKYIFYCYHTLEKLLYKSKNEEYFSMLYDTTSSDTDVVIKQKLANGFDIDV